MKCPNCNQDILIQLATKINCNKCKVITSTTSIITVQCEACKHIFQVPIQSKRIFGVRRDD